jgi:predicted transcriptional regulator of viral defense system
MKPSRTHEQIVLERAHSRGLLHTRDVVALGVPSVVLTRLVRMGQLERAGRGVYSLPDASISAQRSLAEVTLRVPRGVVCLLSALRVHEIGTQAPFEVWLALPPGVAPRITSPALRVMRMSGGAMTEGIERINVDGVPVPVFNAAKTVADCFKFRNKIGLDVALEALREASQGNKVTMDDLWSYATIDRVGRIMRPYMEALVA